MHFLSNFQVVVILLNITGLITNQFTSQQIGGQQIFPTKFNAGMGKLRSMLRLIEQNNVVRCQRQHLQVDQRSVCPKTEQNNVVRCQRQQLHNMMLILMRLDIGCNVLKKGRYRACKMTSCLKCMKCSRSHSNENRSVYLCLESDHNWFYYYHSLA